MTDAQYNAYFDWLVATSNVTDTNDRIANAEKRLEKLLPGADAASKIAEENQRVKDLQIGFENYWTSVGRGVDNEKLHKMFDEWERKFRAQCEKDGITIDLLVGKVFSGKTPKGKKFWSEDNNGITDRSLHCGNLWIDGELVFSSGDFSTVYNTIRKR